MLDLMQYTESQAKEIAKIKGCEREEVGTEVFSLKAVAANLYDGGWRKGDKEELISEYKMTYTGANKEVENICEWFAVFEEEEIK